ncbi:MAG TPA: hypothetical protein VFN73_12145 [Propionibacteriaceae bacterium]|nr:hypothetical protein [Propionibacteriaceae bacterium]
MATARNAAPPGGRLPAGQGDLLSDTTGASLVRHPAPLLLGALLPGEGHRGHDLQAGRHVLQLLQHPQCVDEFALSEMVGGGAHHVSQPGLLSVEPHPDPPCVVHTFYCAVAHRQKFWVFSR